MKFSNFLQYSQSKCAFVYLAILFILSTIYLSSPLNRDVPIPAAFFNKMAPILDKEGGKKARLKVGQALNILRRYNLLKGSLGIDSGLFMHDIVRDYSISLHTDLELHILQGKVIDQILACRPETGFPTADFAGAFTFEVG